MNATSTRRGASLAELLVALAITAVVAAAGAAALLTAERQFRATSTGAADERTLREAESVLRAEVRAADADSIVLRGDTAVEILAHVGASALCVVSGRVVVLPPDESSNGLPLSAWRSSPAPGDIAVVFDSAAPSGWFRTAVDSVSSRSDGAGCHPSSGLLTPTDSALHRSVTRLVLADAVPDPVFAGAPVRLLRRGRYALVKGSDKSWALSYRGCSAPGACGPSQPVVGPLASNAESGLLFALDAMTGTVTVDLRMPPSASGTPGRTRRVTISVPNRRAGAP